MKKHMAHDKLLCITQIYNVPNTLSFNSTPQKTKYVREHSITEEQT